MQGIARLSEERLKKRQKNIIEKDEIGKSISVEEYIAACKKAVMRYTDIWNELTERIGYWVDMKDPYVTYTSKYMESVWWLIKQIHKKGLLYKGYTIQPYSPMAGTGLSSHELNQPGAYQDVTDTTVTAQFKTILESLPEQLKGDIPLYILAWTTTPWTLPSNTALTVGKNIDYIVVSTFNQYTFKPVRLLLAKDLVTKQYGKTYELYATLENYKSKDKLLLSIAKMNIGDAFLELNQPKEAIEYYNKSLSIVKNNLITPITLMKCATIYEQQEDYNNALNYYEQIKIDYPNSNIALSIDKYISKVKIKS